MQRVRFVCLARSHKFHNLCIAGKIITPEGHIGNWFRPIDPDHEDAIPANDFTYGIGDIIDVTIDRPAPTKTQCENHIIAKEPNWTLNGQVALPYLDRFLDHPQHLWGYGNLNGYSFSSNCGMNNRCPVEYLKNGISNSLYLIKVDNCSLKKIHTRNSSRIMALFTYNQITYNLTMTYNFFTDTQFANLPYDTAFPVGASYLTISLGMPYSYQGNQEYCYKLVAGHAKA